MKILVGAALAAFSVSAMAMASKMPDPDALHLPGELSAEEVLNGKYPYPPSPKVDFSYNENGFARANLGEVPPAGVHPRLLFGPSDIAGIRHRLENTEAGKAMVKTMRKRVNDVILRKDGWEKDLYEAMSSGNVEKSRELYFNHGKPNSRAGHYQPYFLYELTLHALDNLIFGNEEAGKKAATAIAVYGEIIDPLLDVSAKWPLADDTWRAKPANSTGNSRPDEKDSRTLTGYHLIGYAYDFAWKYMTEAQREQMRKVIAKSTAGQLWMGARLPHHFRNWNWCAVGLAQPFLALAIEGEKGYDPRVYTLGLDIARDYLTYGISPSGSSTEAVGYTQFGFNWLLPFMVAAERRGDKVLTHDHYRKMLDWYVHSTEPYGGQWTSHGDGGDGGPSSNNMMIYRRFFPYDERVEFIWDNLAQTYGKNLLNGNYHMIEMLIFAADPAVKNPGQFAETVFFDPVRSSLNARSGWDKDAAFMTFECRTDSVAASHEHADRGNFTFSALGKNWAKENFRSVTTQFHNNVVVDGVGQGFWPGPGKFLGMKKLPHGVLATADMSENYRIFWPKTLDSDDLDPVKTPRFAYPRWDFYRQEAIAFQKEYGHLPHEKDKSPSVEQHFGAYEKIGDPRMWDEDSRPMRYTFADFQYAFRSVYLHTSKHPFLLVVDDLKKDDQPRTYSFLMQTGLEKVAVESRDGNQMVLMDMNDGKFDSRGRFRPKKGAPALLVVSLNDPAEMLIKRNSMMMALETFERKDPPAMGGRSFGLDKRLVIPKYQKKGDHKVLLIPFRFGDKRPEIKFDPAAGKLSVVWPDETVEFNFVKGADGRTSVEVK